MAQAERLNQAKAFLTKAQEYLASAEDNLVAERFTAAAGDAIHAGISAKDAIVTALTGATRKGKDHTAAAKELRTALGGRADAAAAEKALRELLGAKAGVEYGTALLSATKPSRSFDVLADWSSWRYRSSVSVAEKAVSSSRVPPSVMGAVIEDEVASHGATATCRRREVTGDADAPAVGRAGRRASTAGTPVPAGGDPRGHPLVQDECRCLSAVRWDDRSGVSGARELSQERAVVSAHRGGGAVGVACHGTTRGLLVAARSAVAPLSTPLGSAPTLDPRVSSAGRRDASRLA